MDEPNRFDRSAGPLPESGDFNAPLRDPLPWKPRVAAFIAVLFGPLAGALVASANLKRLGEPRKAKQVLAFTALACVPVSAAVLRVSEARTKTAGGIIQTAAFLAFLAFQRKEFHAWERATAAADPSMGTGAKRPATASGWSATWRGFLGMIVFAAIVVAVAFTQDALVKRYANRGEELLNAKMYVEAERAYQTALWIDPNNAAIRFNLAGLYMDQEKWDLATQYMRSGLRENPKNASGHFVLAALLAQTGDVEGATKEYCETLRLRPDHAEAEQELRIIARTGADPCHP